MRKLLVASQKGGVGKTTTSINLAAATAMAGTRVLLLDVDPLSSISVSVNLSDHPRRQSLRTTGVDLPGAFVPGVIPGLDLLSPYEEGGCTDQDLDDLLKLLSSPEVSTSYGCMVINTPPFLGANATQLLGTADEFVLVMRAEPMAYRTLPAFLELIQRSKRDRQVDMKGILVTLPEGEQPGGRWERELRGRFGSRLLPIVVPYDDEVGKASVFGQIVTSVAPDAVASKAYQSLVAHLELAADSNPDQLQAESQLLAVAATMRSAGSFTRRSSKKLQKLVAVPSHHGEDESFLSAEDAPAFESASNRIDLPNDADEPVFRSLPEFDLEDDAFELPPPPSAKVPTRRSGPATKPPQAKPPSQQGPPAPTRPLSATPNRPPVSKVAAPSSALTPQSLMVAVGLAIVFGAALRFVSVPEELVPYIVPIVVGIAVSAGIVLVLRLMVVAGDSESQASSPRISMPNTPNTTSQQTKKLPRQESIKETNTRLSKLARQRRGGKK